MKILIVNTLYYPYKFGGAEISVQSIAEGLKEKGIKVAILTLGETSEEVEINNIPVYRHKLENIFWPFDQLERTKIKKLKWHTTDTYNIRYDKDIHRIITKFSPTVIHTNNLMGFSVAIWDVAKEKHIKIVHTLRDFYLQCPKTNKFKNNSACHKQCLECILLSKKKKSISQNVDTIVGISNSILRDHLDKGYFKYSIIKVIYNGFINPEETLQPSNFNKDSFLKFGFIGQINKAKGIEVLMRSLTKLTQYDHWKLYVAGRVDPLYKKHLLSFFPNERIEFMGYTKQTIFFDTINVLIVPSLWEEPFGRVVIEGMLNKVVVLGSKRGGIKEILKSNQKFLFNPLNDELRSLLQLVLETPETLNKFNFDVDRLDTLFSLENMVNQYLSAYKELNN